MLVHVRATMTFNYRCKIHKQTFTHFVTCINTCDSHDRSTVGQTAKRRHAIHLDHYEMILSQSIISDRRQLGDVIRMNEYLWMAFVPSISNNNNNRDNNTKFLNRTTTTIRETSRSKRALQIPFSIRPKSLVIISIQIWFALFSRVFSIYFLNFFYFLWMELLLFVVIVPLNWSPQ